MHDSSLSIDAPPRDLGVIEADQFCDCGYNLHGQRVGFDERLKFPIVQCVECGRFHPAGQGSTATRPWLRRLATMLLVVWIVFVGLWSIAVAGTWFGLSVGIAEEYGERVLIFESTGQVLRETNTEERMETLDAYNRAVEASNRPGSVVAPPAPPIFNSPRYVDAYTGEAVDIGNQSLWRVTSRASMNRAEALRLGLADPDDSVPPLVFALLLIGIAMVLGLISGLLQSVSMPHLSAAMIFVPSLFALAVVGVIFALFYSGDPSFFTFIGHWLWCVGLVALPGVGTWWIALLIGRPIARGLVGVIIPPKPRQLFAYLWHADDKATPSTGTS